LYWIDGNTQAIYEIYSENNASYFIMLPHNVRGETWWYDSRGFANIPLNFVAMQQMAAEGLSDNMVSDMEVRMK